jgi:anti-sigma factor RsiW
MYTCKDSVSLLLDYLDGTLSEDVRHSLQTHLGECDACEHFLQGYRATPTLCRQSLDASMPDALREQLRSFLRKSLGTR